MGLFDPSRHEVEFFLAYSYVNWLSIKVICDNGRLLAIENAFFSNNFHIFANVPQ